MTSVSIILLFGCSGERSVDTDEGLRQRITELKPQSATLSTIYLGCSRPDVPNQCASANVLWPSSTPYEVRRDTLRDTYKRLGATLIVGEERSETLLEYYEARDGSVLALVVKRDISRCPVPSERADASTESCLDRIRFYPRHLSPVAIP